MSELIKYAGISAAQRAGVTCQIAGYHDLPRVYARVVAQGAIARAGAKKEWRRGVMRRLGQEPCGCPLCQAQPIWERLKERTTPAEVMLAGCLPSLVETPAPAEVAHA